MIANPITLKNYFENDNGLNEVGGVDYLVKLTRFSSSIKQAIDYAKVIHESHIKKRINFYFRKKFLKTLMMIKMIKLEKILLRKRSNFCISWLKEEIFLNHI